MKIVQDGLLMLGIAKDGFLLPSKSSEDGGQCDQPAVGLGGVYFLEAKTTTKNQEVLSEEDVVATWRQGFTSGYNRGVMILVKLVECFVTTDEKSHKYRVPPNQIATAKKSRGVRQFCAHNDCIQCESVVYHQAMLESSLDEHLKKHKTPNDIGAHESLKKFKAF